VYITKSKKRLDILSGLINRSRTKRYHFICISNETAKPTVPSKRPSRDIKRDLISIRDLERDLDVCIRGHRVYERDPHGCKRDLYQCTIDQRECERKIHECKRDPMNMRETQMSVQETHRGVKGAHMSVEKSPYEC